VKHNFTRERTKRLYQEMQPIRNKYLLDKVDYEEIRRKEVQSSLTS
jgi:hypothetical protein